MFRIAAPSTRSVDVQLARSASPPAAASGRRPGAGAKENLDLSNIYTPDGLLGDGDTNLIPDRLDTLLVPAGEGVERTLDVAARLGLESAGIVIPIAMPADAVTKPDAEPTMVLIGTTHPIVERLIKEGKLQQPSLQPGEGLIQVVRKAFGEKGAVIVTGGDAAGLARALEQLAERFPHIWARGKDRTTIDDVEEQIRRFVSNRSPEGQAAAALYAIDRIGRELEGKQLEQATVSVHVDKADPGLRDFVRQAAANRLKAGQIEVVVDNRDVQKAGTIFEDDFTVASEVKQFWDVFEARVLPAVRKGRPMTIEARLSEPPDVRRAHRTRGNRQARGERRQRRRHAGHRALGLQAGVQLALRSDSAAARRQADRPDHDSIRRDRASAGVGAAGDVRADAVAARALSDRRSAGTRPEDRGQPDPLREDAPSDRWPTRSWRPSTDGRELLRQTFEPKIVVRPFFDRFPDYEHVRVTTGWLSAAVDGRTVVDERMITDPERFWDHYPVEDPSADVRLRDGARRGQAASPRMRRYFGELTVDLTLSEPDYQVGVDKEQIASMEALHEEIYFNTLHFFDVLGRNSARRGPRLSRPCHSDRPAESRRSGRSRQDHLHRIRSIRPAVVVTYRESGGATGKIRRDIPARRGRSSVGPGRAGARWTARRRAARRSRQGGHGARFA